MSFTPLKNPPTSAFTPNIALNLGGGINWEIANNFWLIDDYIAQLIAGGGGGGGGTGGPDTITSASTSSSLSFSTTFNLFVKATGGVSGITLTLPAASSGNLGQLIRIVKVDSGAGAITISPAGAQVLNWLGLSYSTPQTSYQLTNRYQYVLIESDGSAWWVVGNN